MRRLSNAAVLISISVLWLGCFSGSGEDSAPADTSQPPSGTDGTTFDVEPDGSDLRTDSDAGISDTAQSSRPDSTTDSVTDTTDGRILRSRVTDSNGNPRVSMQWDEDQIVRLDVSEGDAIAGEVDAALGDDTLVEIPGGKYRWETFVDADELDHFGIAAAPGETVVIEPSEPANSDVWPEPGVVLTMARMSGGTAFAGIRWDIRDKDKDAGTVVVTDSGDALIQDLYKIGESPEYRLIATRAESAEGTVVLEGCDASYGVAKDMNWASGVLVGPDHAGELYIDDCVFNHWASKGVYASNPWELSDAGRGYVRISNSKFHNNNIYAIRIGHGDIVDCDFLIDDATAPRWGHAAQNGWNWDRAVPNRLHKGTWPRILRLKGQVGSPEVTVRDVDVEVRPTTSFTSTSPTFVLNNETALTVENMRYLHDNAETYPFHISDTAAEFKGNSSITIQSTLQEGIEVDRGLKTTTFEDWCFDIETPSDALFRADSDVELTGGSVRLGGSKLNDGDATVTQGPNVASGSGCEKPSF